MTSEKEQRVNNASGFRDCGIMPTIVRCKGVQVHALGYVHWGCMQKAGICQENTDWQRTSVVYAHHKVDSHSPFSTAAERFGGILLLCSGFGGGWCIFRGGIWQGFSGIGTRGAASGWWTHVYFQVEKHKSEKEKTRSQVRSRLFFFYHFELELKFLAVCDWDTLKSSRRIFSRVSGHWTLKYHTTERATANRRIKQLQILLSIPSLRDGNTIHDKSDMPIKICQEVSSKK